jgi:hypothetical protein
MDKMFLSYVAGFFDGEGSAYSVGNKLTAKISQIDRRPLDLIVEEFGCGKVYTGVNKRRPDLQPVSQVVFAWKTARYFLTQIEPYLIVKKDNVSALLDQNGREYTY